MQRDTRSGYYLAAGDRSPSQWSELRSACHAGTRHCEYHGQKEVFFNGSASSEVSIRGGFSLSANGSRENQTDWRLDNVDNNEVSAGGIGILPSIDAIQEFKVVTSELLRGIRISQWPNRSANHQIEGTNEIHGTACMNFCATLQLNAKDFFAT